MTPAQIQELQARSAALAEEIYDLIGARLGDHDSSAIAYVALVELISHIGRAMGLAPIEVNDDIARCYLHQAGRERGPL